jgi:hypothetical protein
MRCQLCSARRVIVAVVLVQFVGVALAGAQSWKSELERALENSVYIKSKYSKLGIERVTEPGTVLVVKQDGILAQPLFSSLTHPTLVRDGQVRQAGGVSAFLSSGSDRSFKVGERVYLYDVDVNDKNIELLIVTCDFHDVIDHGRTRQTRYKGFLRFEFPEGALATATPEALEELFSKVISKESAEQAPKTIELGQTQEQVETILGKPERIVKLADKVTYFYKDMKVIFVDGKVVDVQ